MNNLQFERDKYRLINCIQFVAATGVLGCKHYKNIMDRTTSYWLAVSVFAAASVPFTLSLPPLVPILLATGSLALIAYTANQIFTRYNFKQTANEIEPLFRAILSGDLANIKKSHQQLKDKLHDKQWRSYVPLIDFTGDRNHSENTIAQLDFALKVLDNLVQLGIEKTNPIIDLATDPNFDKETKAFQDFAASEQTKKIEKLPAKGEAEVKEELWKSFILLCRSDKDPLKFIQRIFTLLNEHYPKESYAKVFANCKTMDDYVKAAKTFRFPLNFPFKIEDVYERIEGKIKNFDYTAFSIQLQAKSFSLTYNSLENIKEFKSLGIVNGNTLEYLIIPIANDENPAEVSHNVETTFDTKTFSLPQTSQPIKFVHVYILKDNKITDRGLFLISSNSKDKS